LAPVEWICALSFILHFSRTILILSAAGGRQVAVMEADQAHIHSIYVSSAIFCDATNCLRVPLCT